jgi:hypothetical protein
MRPDPGTNQFYRERLAALDREIHKVELDLVSGRTATFCPDHLADLWRQRRAIKLLLMRRTIEQCRPVVNFKKWREGE